MVTRSLGEVQLHSLPYPRLLVTIPSHFLNLPPKPYMQEYASTSQLHLSKTSCHHSKACLKPPPLKTLHATVFLNFTASPLQNFWARFQVIFLTSPPQNLSCKNIFCFSKASLGWGQSRIAVDSFETIVSIEHVRFGCPQRHVILQMTWLPNNCFWLLNQCFIVSK